MALNRYSQDRDTITHADIFAFLRKYSFTIAVFPLIAAAIAFIYVLTAEPRFSATAQILIDTSGSPIFKDKTGAAEPVFDTPQVESQIAVLRSETIARRVIEKLDLTADPEFQAAGPSIFRRALQGVRGLLPGSSADQDGHAEFVKSRAALATFQRNLDVRRLGLSYALDISFTSNDPEKAARIANTAAEAYVLDQVQSKASVAGQSSAWLEQRINELREQLNAAARAVQLFRGGRNLQGPQAPAGNDRGEGQEGRAPVTLAELEAKAYNYQKTYETYLQAFTDAVQRQTFPVSNARVLTPATRPLVKSSPRTKLILALGLLLGAMTGLLIAFLRHSMDDTLQSVRQIREEIGIDCLAQVPKLKNQGDTETRFREVSRAPYTAFASALKYARNSITGLAKRKAVKAIGVTSALPREGKTTVAGNLAALLAMSRRKVLLIDMDIHGSMLSHALAPYAKTGLIEALEGSCTLQDAIKAGAENGPDILPCAASKPPVYAYDLFASSAMAALLAEARKLYDYIIVDMPPQGPVVETVTIAGLLDGVLIVAEWNKTPVPLIEEAVRSLTTADAKILGAVLTKADPALSKMGKEEWCYQS